MPSNENADIPADLLALIRAGLDNNLPKEEYERRRQDIASRINQFVANPPPVAGINQPPVGVNITAPQAEDPYAPTAWGGPKERDFTCPSGQKCRVRKVDIIDLIGSGLLNDVDFLTSIVSSTHIPNADKPGSARANLEVEAVRQLAGNEGKMTSFTKTMDSVLLRVVAKPALFPVPIDSETQLPDDSARVDGRVYIDTIDTTDKIAIFNWAVTGKESAQLQQFRAEAAQSVGSVEDVEVVSTTTVELPGDNSAD